jgi:signal transduction histidine kinase/ActR/RegA family two-component response regulator
MRLRTSLLLVSAATATPVVIFALLAAWLVFDQVNAGIVNAALARNRATLAAVDAELQAAVGVLRALSASPSLERGDLQAFHRDASIVLSTQPSWQNVVLVTHDGRHLVNARLPWGTTLLQEPADPASLQAAVSNRRPSFGNVAIPPSIGARPGVAVRVPLVRGSDVALVLTAVLSPLSFQQVIEAQQLPPGWVSGLVGTDGRIIARVPSVVAASLASENYRFRTASSDEGWYRGTTLEGLETFTAFSKSPLTGWSIGFAIPAQAVVGGAWRSALLMGLGVAMSIGSAIAICLWLGRRVAGPMAELTRASKSLGAGKAFAPVHSQIDEIAETSQALSEAANLIQQRDQALHESRRELEQRADQLRVMNVNKTRFLTLLSHELRNPLAPLRTGAALLGISLPPERQAQIRQMIERQVVHMTRMIDDLLDVSRIDRGELTLQRELVDLADVVCGAVESARPYIEGKGQSLTVHCESSTLIVDADPVRIGQIVSNLLTNASRYTPEGGRIGLRAHASGAGTDAELLIADNGIGFDPGDEQRMFDMFVRLESSSELHTGGLGIGLPIARALANAHGGDVQASSEGAGRGSTFTLRLPLSASAQPRAMRTAPVSRGATRRRLLVVDDDPDVTTSLADWLRSVGHEVQVAHDGARALEIATAFRPEHIFLDLDLPGIGGLEVARRLRSEAWSRSITLVALTGHGQEADKKAAIAAGFDLHLVKPADPDLILGLASAGPERAGTGSSAATRLA